MAVTGVTNNYSTYTEHANPIEKTAGKTTEQNKTGKNDEVNNRKEASKDPVSDYYNYLRDNYSILKSGDVNISRGYLQKCIDDPEEAENLENTLKSLPDSMRRSYEHAKASANAIGAHLTYYRRSVSIHSDGSMSSVSVGVIESGPGAARKEKELEKARKKAEEKREKEKLEEKKRKEAAEEKKRLEKAEQEQIIQENLEAASTPDANVLDLSMEFVEVSSELEAMAVLQNNIPNDAYHDSIDVIG